MKTVKRFFLLFLLVCILTAALCSCGGGESEVVDLSVLSTTMAYSELVNMTAKPERYLDRTVKMRGTFSVYASGGNVYYSCTVNDATACCSEGLEFILEGDHSYPAEGTEIVVSGVFDTYTENGSTYCYLKHATLE